MSHSELISKEQRPPSNLPGSDWGYSAHRIRQRRRILAAAEALFIESGVDRVSMLEVTVAAGVQPSTLYQYFKRKEDIALAIAGEIISDFQSRLQVRLAEQKTGLEKVAALLEMMSTDLEKRSDKVRFMAEFDVLYAHRLPADSLRCFMQLGPESYDELKSWITAGIADGSMRLELDPKITLHAVLNAAVGMQRRLASLGSKVEQEYGRPVVALFREAMRVLLLGLSTEPKSQKQAKPERSEATKTPRRKGKQT